MASFERFDICMAHQALENDWHEGGWLQERPSNVRRMEATHVQLDRMGYSAGMGQGGTFGALGDGPEGENARDIYIEALVSFGLAKLVDPDDEIADYVRSKYIAEYIAEHFPQIVSKQ